LTPPFSIQIIGWKIRGKNMPPISHLRAEENTKPFMIRVSES